MKPIKVIICTHDQFREKQGIHLNCPDTWYLNDAIQRAEKDLFETIYCHYQTKGAAMYCIPYDMLNMLQLGLGIKVKFTHPADTSGRGELDECGHNECDHTCELKGGQK